MYIPAMVGEVGPASSRFIKGRRCPPPLKAPSDPQREIFPPVHRKRMRAAIKPYVRKLEHAAVPRSTVKAATTMMLLLLGGSKNDSVSRFRNS
jgi:hypothetical protein